MKVTKLTKKFQMTVPKEVRNFLEISSDDGLQWEICGEQLVVKKILKMNLEWHKSIEKNFSEWNSAEDDEAYDSL